MEYAELPEIKPFLNLCSVSSKHHNKKHLWGATVHKNINVVLQRFILHVENYVAVEKYK